MAEDVTAFKRVQVREAGSSAEMRPMEVGWEEARSQLAPGEGGDVLKPPPPALASMVQSGGEKPEPEARSQTPGGGSEQKGFFQLSTIKAPAPDDAPVKAAKKPKVNTAPGEGKPAKSCSRHTPVPVDERLPADKLPEFFSSGKHNLRFDPYGNYEPAALEKWLCEIGEVHALPPLRAPACLRRHHTCQTPLC